MAVKIAMKTMRANAPATQPNVNASTIQIQNLVVLIPTIVADLLCIAKLSRKKISAGGGYSGFRHAKLRRHSAPAGINAEPNA
ncbi:MAG TPA: hypothetical protein VGG30_04525 [Pirellulales bacterium]|jgi:hypothetical protein